MIQFLLLPGLLILSLTAPKFHSDVFNWWNHPVLLRIGIYFIFHKEIFSKFPNMPGNNALTLDIFIFTFQNWKLKQFYFSYLFLWVSMTFKKLDRSLKFLAATGYTIHQLGYTGTSILLLFIFLLFTPNESQLLLKFHKWVIRKWLTLWHVLFLMLAHTQIFLEGMNNNT